MTEKEFREKYYEVAKKQTLETLPAFLNEILNKTPHDYGSICCAVAASALAAAHAANHAESGGITGFQAGAVMWEFIQQWNYSSNKCGLRLIDYDNMLYAQYYDNFQKTIPAHVFKALQKEAQKNLEEDIANYAKYLDDMEKYKKDLDGFIIRYPDYQTDPKKYDRLVSGTGVEWEAERKKEASGFEFAPQKPWYSRPSQINHWKSIVSGIAPFGYEIKED